MMFNRCHVSSSNPFCPGDLFQMISTLEPPSLLDQWRQRLGGRHRRSQPRPLAVMGYLTDEPVIDGLIEVEKLTLVLLYDDLIHPRQCALRLAGYSGSGVPWGVRFGGRANCRFVKDLTLQPVPGGEGYRIDLTDEALLTLALQLERKLAGHARLPQQLRERPFLPKLWAGFRPEAAADIIRDDRDLAAHSPELAAYASRVRRTPASLLQHLSYDHQGLIVFPLAWVSRLWQQAIAVYADVWHFHAWQTFRLRQPSDLAGFHDAAEFDFVIRSGVKQRRSRTTGAQHALDNSNARAG